MRLSRKDRIPSKNRSEPKSEDSSHLEIKDLGKHKHLNFKPKSILPLPKASQFLEAEAHIEKTELFVSEGEIAPLCHDFPDDSDSWHHFQPEHPLSEQYHVKVVEESSELVPDFKGGPLPRSDKHDREFYCSTMLVLFKPWRSGKELKGVLERWDDSFSAFKFSPRQLELMKN